MHEFDWGPHRFIRLVDGARWLGCASVNRDCERSNESATPQGVEIEGP
jgi:hypothetical protein